MTARTTRRPPRPGSAGAGSRPTGSPAAPAMSGSVGQDQHPAGHRLVRRGGPRPDPPSAGAGGVGVVEVVPALAEGEQGEGPQVGAPVVAPGAERALTDQVTERVHAPGDVVEQRDAHKSRPQQGGYAVHPRTADGPAHRERQASVRTHSAGKARATARVSRSARRSGAMGVPRASEAESGGAPAASGRCGTASRRARAAARATGRADACRSGAASAGRRAVR